ncbi:phosphonate ABC transporter ATP-binding protein [Paenibacillus alkalitolerans]|uniref:phosphonate ABC transporter ATP-binding protein n=1 Tax=Paenibacillus alkalitolerans TaxID=2799335 RepID=UPI0018F593B5|nr:phosphonate ABC transporter ATP-binding protein [Paenibacillus alkalitolerans]
MLLQVQQLSKSFGSKPVLHQVDFQADRGEFIAVLGSSGAGKSTLLRCINGLVIPTSGKVDVLGMEMNRKNLQRVRRHVGFIFQNFNVIGNLSVLQNVLIGLLGAKGYWNVMFSREEKRKAEEVIDIVGLGDKLHERADRLSGGQKQRVGIARVLAQNPDIILADEPVSNLDPVTSREIMDILRTINETRGTVILCNLHQLELAAEYGHRIIGIHSGRVCFNGNAHDLRDEDLSLIYGGKYVGNTETRVNHTRGEVLV